MALSSPPNTAIAQRRLQLRSRRLHPREFEWRVAHFDRLAGTDRLRQAIEGGTLPSLLREWEAEARAFQARRQPYLLYP